MPRDPRGPFDHILWVLAHLAMLAAYLLITRYYLLHW